MPSAWIDRIFDKLSSLYGSKLADLWGGCDMETVRQDWAEMLADYTGEEIKRGLAACMRRSAQSAPYPPTLPEFAVMCRPPIDFESAYVEALEQMHNRERFDDQGNSCDRWASPAIYWAAVKFGVHDMRNTPYRHAATRWASLLNEYLGSPHLQPVPAVPNQGIKQLPRKYSAEELERNKQRAMGIAAQLAGSMNVRNEESGSVNPYWAKVAEEFERFPDGAVISAIKAHAYRGAKVPERLAKHARECSLKRYLPLAQQHG